MSTLSLAGIVASCWKVVVPAGVRNFFQLVTCWDTLTAWRLTRSSRSSTRGLRKAAFCGPDRWARSGVRQPRLWGAAGAPAARRLVPCGCGGRARRFSAEYLRLGQGGGRQAHPALGQMRSFLNAYGAKGEVEKVMLGGDRPDLLVIDPLDDDVVVVEFKSHIREARRSAPNSPPAWRTGRRIWTYTSGTMTIPHLVVRPNSRHPRHSPDPSRRQHYPTNADT